MSKCLKTGIPVLLCAVILAGCSRGVRFEPGAAQSFSRAEKQVASGKINQADRELRVAISRTSHKADAYLNAIKMLSPDLDSSQDVLRTTVGLAEDLLRLSDQKKLDRPLTEDESKELLTSLGQLYYQLHHTQEAFSTLEKANKLWPDDEVICNALGYFYADTNTNLQSALRLTRKAVKLNPDNYAYLDSLAWTYYRLGRNREALNEQLEAVKLQPDDGDLRLHLGVIYSALNKPFEASIEFQKAKILASGSTRLEAEGWLKKLGKH